ncbi:18931_t:CDS:2, partial [Acaulospora morrowiae]
EDTLRLRKIIDQALSLDPRIEKFKKEERAAKEAKKKEKEEAAKNAKEAAKRAAEEEKSRKEQAEAEAKQKQQEEKKKKEARKKSIRTERKNIKTHLKSYNYFYPANESPPVEVIDAQLSELDTLFENLTLEELQTVRKQMDSANDGQSAKQVLISEATRLISSGVFASDSITHFKQSGIIENTLQSTISIEKPNVTEVSKEEPKERPWSEKANCYLTCFFRWEKISEYVADHTGLSPRSNEELIKKSKEVQKGANALNEEDVRKLQHQKKHADTRINEHPSMREATINYDDPLHAQVEEAPNGSHESAKPKKTKAKSKSSSQPVESPITNVSAANPDSSTKTSEETPINGSTSAATSSNTTSSVQSTTVWTATQQAQLERALQMYPPSWKGDGDRWDKIAAAVEGKTKKECKLRVKHITEQVKAKKAAQSTNSK